MEETSHDETGGCMTESPGMLKIAAAECRPIRLEFRLEVSHSLASRNFTENILVQIKSDSEIYGFGEGIPREYVTGETIESVLAASGKMLSIIENKCFYSSDEVVVFLRDLGKSFLGKENPSALCAVELALLDLTGKNWNLPVSEIIGLKKSEEPLVYSLVVPLMGDHAFDLFFSQAKHFGFTNVKIKVNAHNPSEKVARVKKTLGDNVEVRVDANCSWDRTNAVGYLKELADLGVVSVEQPLCADDLEGCANLRDERLMLITLDESVSSISSVHKIASHGACDVLNVRVSKCGGLLGSLDLINTARENGLKIQLGAHVGESCILSAAGAHLAAGTPSFKWREGCFGKHLLKKGLCEEELQFTQGGLLIPPNGQSGLGITVDKTLMKEAQNCCDNI